MATKHLRLAADTNVLVDIEDGDENVLDAVEAIGRRLPNADWVASPTVLEELASLCDSGETERLRRNAGMAIEHLRLQSQFRPLLELPLGDTIAAQIPMRDGTAVCCQMKKTTTH